MESVIDTASSHGLHKIKIQALESCHRKISRVTRYQNNLFTFPGCGSVVSNSLKSPGYPSNYPNNMNCVYQVPIPYGMAMNIYFSDFYLEGGSCRLVPKSVELLPA